MDPAKSACDMVTTCWDRTANYRKYIRSLGDNLVSLESKTDELRSVYEDVKRLVERAEGERWIQKDDPARWLRTVKDLREEAGRIVVDGRRMILKSCLCGICFINCRARYHQSKLAEAKRTELETELAQGRGFRVKEDVAYESADLFLERSLGVLRDKRDELREVFETVKLRVEKEEEGHLVRTPEVAGWLKTVGDLLIENEVLEILQQGREELEKVSRHGAGDDPQSQRNSQSYYVMSKRADEKSDMLRKKLEQYHGFTVLTYKPVDPLIVGMPLECHVGAESTFQEVWDWVRDENVKRIGLFGMGGVGKTTLLKRLHNQFLQDSHDYDFVVWVVVSKQMDLDKIQKAILEKLKVQADDWKDRDTTGRAELIRMYLKNKNCLLFLDDLWDPIDLVEHVGIPSRPKKQKIIFTTREERVCNRMKADRTKRVECLQPKDALKLFHENLGEKTWRAHQLIPVIAERLVHECKYLPLAVKTVAGAMVGKTELKCWMDAEYDMKNRLSKFEDIQEDVLVRLEFSYDRLPDEAHKKCFLYLSIFPEDHEIFQDDAVDLWIGEGFLDECANVHDARDKGEEIFRRLKEACLVEFVEDVGGVEDAVYQMDPTHCLKMHDVVREMALWVCSKLGQKSNIEPLRPEELKKWKDADRIFLREVSSTLHDSLATTLFPHLSTLIIQFPFLSTVGSKLLDFFSSMPCLRVLQLSHNSLDVFPNSIWNLRNLRYLKITSYRVTVPVEIKNLTHLEVLILPLDGYLPPEALSAISSLRVLHMFSDRGQSNIDEPECIDALERMESLEELSIGLREGAEKLLGSPKLSSLLRDLLLSNSSGLDILRISKSWLRRLENLRSMSFENCPNLGRIDISCEDDGLEGTCSYAESLAPPPKPSWFSSEYFLRSLICVKIYHCDHLVNVTSLLYHAPVLETLDIFSCSSLEELIVDDVEDDQVISSRLFPSLKYLALRYLGSFRSICRRALPFPSLKEILVWGCPRLKKLPLNRNSAKDSLQVIDGATGWWEGLQWDDPVAKQLFAKFSIERWSRSH